MLDPVGVAVGGSEGKCISVVGVFSMCFFFFSFLYGDPAIHQSFKTVTKIVIFMRNCKGIECFCLHALLYLKLRHDWIRRTLRFQLFSTFLRRIFRLGGQTKAFVVSALPSLPAAYVLYLM